ncbi:hypothetical protein G4B88_030781 [Cannabis sativa]|uniref:Uncharacterized protein n=1 Tax=Cannabis sativa TaxID=3483 RepID=A0A7J6HAN8_CANSA|nr:hypothetical protein G4B88_030781 [Cannabis sativa]
MATQTVEDSSRSGSRRTEGNRIGNNEIIVLVNDAEKGSDIDPQEAQFLLCVLTATLGGMFLCGANDLITIFVAPEYFSLCFYLLSRYTKK